MAEIKSALELALEKAEQYGRASKEEMELAQYQEQGRRLAVEFLKGEGDLAADLKSLPPQDQPAARLAVKEVFLRNLGLPRENAVDPRQDRAMEGLLLAADNRQAMANLQTEMEQVLQQFLHFRSNALQQLQALHIHLFFADIEPVDGLGLLALAQDKIILAQVADRDAVTENPHRHFDIDHCDLLFHGILLRIRRQEGKKQHQGQTQESIFFHCHYFSTNRIFFANRL